MDKKGEQAPPCYTQGYPQPQGPYQGHQSYPGKQQDAEPTTVVVVNQPLQGQGPQDYTFDGSGRTRGGVLIFVALVNLLAFIVMAIIWYNYNTSGWKFYDSGIAFIFYLIAGILGVVGANKQHSSSGIAIACIVMSSFGLCVAFGQSVWRILSQPTLDPGGSDSAGNFGTVHMVMTFLFTFIAIFCLFSLIASATKVVCYRPKSRGHCGLPTTELGKPVQRPTTVSATTSIPARSDALSNKGVGLWLGHHVGIFSPSFAARSFLISLIVHASKTFCCRPKPEGIIFYQQRRADQSLDQKEAKYQTGQMH